MSPLEGWAAPLLLSALVWAALVLPSRTLVEEEFDALKAIRWEIKEDPFGSLSSWNTSHSGPCGWFGVTCSDSQDHVVALKLFGCSLVGTLSSKIGSLTYLKELTLGGNLFNGSIPKQIGSLKALDLLDLKNNTFSGFIPKQIGGLTSISKIYLSNNQFTGSLPPELGKLTTLEELWLDDNKFCGEIPATNSPHLSYHDNKNASDALINATGLCLLSRLKVGDFSFNYFTGQIPSCLGYLPSTSFGWNCFWDKNALHRRPTKECKLQVFGPSISNQEPSSEDHRKSQFKSQQPYWLLILEIVIGAALALLVALCAVGVALSIRKRAESFSAVPSRKIARSNEDKMISIDDKMPRHALKFNHQELELACEDFSNVIGSSTDGMVYKGTMENGAEIAVVSLCTPKEDWTGHHERHFQCEVENLARLDHENVAKMLGYCEEREPFCRMFIFEYQMNGTLFEHLHYGSECQLSWSRRIRIAIGIARGLNYLHTKLQPPFTLSELHSSTIYLTEEFLPKLVDFHSYKAMLSRSEKSGSMIHRAAFWSHRQSIQRKRTDVEANTYAFGVLLLEIISGRPPLCNDRGSLVEWATGYLDKPDMLHNLVDPSLKHFNYAHLHTICKVVKICLEAQHSKMPSMEILTSMLESEIGTSVSDTLREFPLEWAELTLTP